MVGENQTFSMGVSIDRLPLFTGENYPFWKVRMQIFLESINRGIWDAILNGPFVPTITVNNLQEPKLFSQWTAEENSRAKYDVRARNIISSSLTLDEFYRISVCTSAQEMWEILRVAHEGTYDVKCARKNSLIQEYEMFRMQQGETIYDVQKRFTHIVNHLWVR